MAVSPTFGTSNQYIKYRIVVDESNTNISANTSQVTVYVQAWRTNTGYTTDGYGTCYCGINGSSYSNSWRYQDGHAITYNSYTELFRTTVTIPHNADGTKSIWVSASISHDTFSASDQGFTVTLGTIPRYATSNQSLSSKTETTIKMNWSSNSTIDYIWYSKNNGSSWTAVGGVNATSGSYTISGLTANTTYNIKTRVRRKDSQLTTDSSALSIATYDYPKPTSANNFTIGNGASVNLYNPLGRKCTLQLIGADNSVIGTYTGTYNGVINAQFKTADAIDKQYKSIPNSVSGTYQTKVTYSGVVKTGPSGTYSVNASSVLPNIGTVAYEDIESSSLEIAEDDQLIIQNVSRVQYTASGLTTQQYATINKVEVIVNNQTYQLTVSGDTAQGGNASINSSQDVEAVFKITDSRGLTKTKSLAITMLEYSLPNAIITLNRRDNYYNETTILVDGNYSSLNGKNSATIQYRYKKKSDVNYSPYIEIQDNVPYVFNVDNAYYWDVQVKINDLLGSVTYNRTVNKGIPIVYYDIFKRSVGVDCFPNNDEDFEVKNVSFTGLSTKVNFLNEAISYSTTEKVVGTWINGETLYRKTISTGTLPSGAGYKNVNHSISDLSKVVRFYGYAHSSSDSIPLPFAPSGNDAKSGIAVKVTSSQIQLIVNQNQSAYTESYITLEYTKSR